MLERHVQGPRLTMGIFKGAHGWQGLKTIGVEYLPERHEKDSFSSLPSTDCPMPFISKLSVRQRKALYLNFFLSVNIKYLNEINRILIFLFFSMYVHKFCHC